MNVATEDEKLPFYLNSSKSSVITRKDILAFKNNNPALSNFIDAHVIELKPIELGHFEAFCYWIIGQQISGKAAEAIAKRFIEYVVEISPQSILSKPVEGLRAVGLSKNKANYIINLANFFLTNILPDFEKQSSQEIIKYFSEIKGVGEWTVQMHLIFSMGRMDILATKDLVVRKGIQVLYGLVSVPSEKEANNICKSWGEKATIGTILAWAVMGE